jgi:hypothetical protein
VIDPASYWQKLLIVVRAVENGEKLYKLINSRCLEIYYLWKSCGKTNEFFHKVFILLQEIT